MEFNKVYSYLISPAGPVMDDVAKFKNLCQHMIGDFDSRKSLAHLTVTKPGPEKISVMLNKCRRLTNDLIKVPATTFNVNGFDFFDNKSEGFVIYLKVELNDYQKNWFRQVRSVLGDNSSAKPHITIARGLTDQQFLTLWPYFQHLEYNSNFQANHLTILENELTMAEHPNKAAILKKIPFGSDKLSLVMPLTLFDMAG